MNLSGNFGASNLYLRDGDLNGDGVLAFADFLLLANNFGQTGPTGVWSTTYRIASLCVTTRVALASQSITSMEPKISMKYLWSMMGG